jgi:tRNA 2-thiocytidine biosynthesis protein TtcA
MLHAMGHVVKSHLLDRNLYPFTTLQTTGVASAEGDIAFDDEPCATPASKVIAVHPHRDDAEQPED